MQTVSIVQSTGTTGADGVTAASVPERAEKLGEIVQTKVVAAINPVEEFAREGIKLSTNYGLRVVGALVLIIIAWMISKWVRRAVLKGLDHSRLDQTVARFFASVAGWSVLLLALIACLSIFGVETSSVAAVLGAAGLAIGLAVQGSLSNLAAGMMLLVLRPFRVGDVISVAGISGTVQGIELFTTSLDSAENRRLLVPNSQIFGSIIDNQTHHQTRCVQIVIPVDHSADIEATRRALQLAAGSIEKRLAHPESKVWLNAMTGGGVEWMVNMWCLTGDVLSVKEQLLTACKRSLEKSGLIFPATTSQVFQRPYQDPVPTVDHDRLLTAVPGIEPKLKPEID